MDIVYASLVIPSWLFPLTSHTVHMSFLRGHNLPMLLDIEQSDLETCFCSAVPSTVNDIRNYIIWLIVYQFRLWNVVYPLSLFILSVRLQESYVKDSVYVSPGWQVQLVGSGAHFPFNHKWAKHPMISLPHGPLCTNVLSIQHNAVRLLGTPIGYIFHGNILRRWQSLLIMPFPLPFLCLL